MSVDGLVAGFGSFSVVLVLSVFTIGFRAIDVFCAAFILLYALLRLALFIQG